MTFVPYDAVWRVSPSTEYDVIVLSEPENGIVKAIIAPDDKRHPQLEILTIRESEIE